MEQAGSLTEEPTTMKWRLECSSQWGRALRRLSFNLISEVVVDSMLMLPSGRDPRLWTSVLLQPYSTLPVGRVCRFPLSYIQIDSEMPMPFLQIYLNQLQMRDLELESKVLESWVRVIPVVEPPNGTHLSCSRAAACKSPGLISPTTNPLCLQGRPCIDTKL